MNIHAPVRDAQAWTALVTLQHGTSGRAPFFCVHGAGGNVLNYRELSRRLGAAQPFFALQAAGIDGVARPHASIPEMARAYLVEVRARQSHGPYLIGGYSGGGILAYEMAQQLTRAGESIGLLALIDTMHPRTELRTITWQWRLSRLWKERLRYVIEGLRRRVESFRKARGLHAIERHLARGEAIPFALRELHLLTSYRRALAHYEPKPWGGRAVLFRAERPSPLIRIPGPTYGWDREILGGVEVVPVAGDHQTLLYPGNVAPLAVALGAAIDRAGRLSG